MSIVTIQKRIPNPRPLPAVQYTAFAVNSAHVMWIAPDGDYHSKIGMVNGEVYTVEGAHRVVVGMNQRGDPCRRLTPAGGCRGVGLSV